MAMEKQIFLAQGSRDLKWMADRQHDESRMRHLPHPCLSRSGVEVSIVTRVDVRKKKL